MTVASIHQNSFAMNVEWPVKTSCGICTSFYFQFKTYFIYSKQNLKKKLFALFLQIHETPYPSFPSLSSKRDHEEMEQGDDEVMEGTDKKIKT